MRCTKLAILFLFIVLIAPSFALAAGQNTLAANPPQPVIVLSQSAIPFIMASSGTMGNNGAISAMTALPRTFSGGAWLWLPAGAVAAGVPASAAWLWFVGSSTTAGTVYNSTYSSGNPTIGVQTAFATTGPGAYVGSVATITAASITLFANSVGINGRVAVKAFYPIPSSAGQKQSDITFGGGACQNLTYTTQTSFEHHCTWTNRGLTNRQGVQDFRVQSDGLLTPVFFPADGSIDTTANVTINFTLAKNTATEHIILDTFQILVYPGN